MRNPAETQAYAFTVDELEWLTSFKEAVAAGLFSEWAVEPEADKRGRMETSETSYPSDPRDITRLLVCRRAVRAGFYHED
jgi:hypothetical protein